MIKSINKYEEFSKIQLISELKKRDEQIDQLQKVSFNNNYQSSEHLLKESESKLQAAKIAAKLGYYSFNISKGIMTNAEYLDVIFEVEEETYNTIEGWIKIIHPDFTKSVQKHIMVDVIQNKQPFNKEYKIISTINNKEKWVHGKGNLKLNENGEPIEMFGTIQDITERKQIEEALKERESKLVESQKVANLGHYSLDVASGLWTNSEQLDLIFEIDENFSKNAEGWQKIIHPDFYESIQTHLMVDVLKNKQPFNKEYKIISLRTKQEKWIHGKGNLKLNEKGEPIEMFGTIQEITKRKIIEKALLEREAKLLESQKVAKLGHYSFDVLTGMWTNSEQLDEIFELGEYFSKNVEGWMTIIHPDFLESMQKHLMVDVLKNKQQFNKEYKIITLLTKQEKWVHGKGNLKLNENGEPIEMFGTIQDITKRKLIEEALLESEAKLRILFDKSLDAIFVVDKQTGKYIDVNSSSEKLTGYSLNEIKNLTTKDISPIGTVKRLKKISTANKVIDFGEVEYIRKDRTKRIVDLTVIPINKNYSYGIAHDITDKKKIENEIIEARNTAIASDKLKSEFLAQMSHEIRSPINIILNFLSLIKEETAELKNEILETSFSSIDNSTKRIIRTIDLILHMSDLQLGTYTVTLNNIEIKNQLKTLYNEYKSLAELKNLKLLLLMDVEKDNVTIDDYALKQIIANLIDNAIKYTHEGSIEIRLTENDRNYLLEVDDSGIGISEEYLPNLFSAFSQESEGYSRHFDGTGLGLSLVKKYCDIINAVITVRSKKNEGTTFCLQIPKN